MSEPLMINQVVPYSFGHKISSGKIIGIRITTDIISGTAGVGVFNDYSYTIDDGDAIRSDFKQQNFDEAGKKRIEQLRKVLRSEGISYLELSELESLKDYIDDGDVEMLEASGVPEHE